MDNAIQEVTDRALVIPEQAQGIKVVDNATYEQAGEVLKGIKALRKEIADTFKPIKQKMDAAKREVLAQEKAADAPLVEAERYLKPQISAYLAEQERIRREAERKAQEAARKAAEEAQLAEAAALEAQGNKEAAEAVIAAPVHTPAVVLPKTTPKVAGVSVRTIWKYRIVDDSILPRAYMLPDERAIGAIARSQKDRASIPGVEFYSEDSVAAGGA